MNQSYVQFQIKNMRTASIQRVMEALMVMLFCLFTMAVGPSLIVKYFYSDPTQQLLQPPAVLEYMPDVLFGIAALYTIFVVVTNIGRAQKIRQLEQDLYFSSGNNDTDADVDDDELKELEQMVDEAMASKGTRKTARKSGGKKRK
jgi:protein-S-isoprenylcysteine O-methyltransferase Ste14